MGRANAECQGKNGKWMCAGCTVQEGKRIDGEDGEELLKIREAKHRNPRRMLKREKKKEKSVLFFF